MPDGGGLAAPNSANEKMRKAALLLGAMPKDKANSVLELMPPALSLALKSQIRDNARQPNTAVDLERALAEFENFLKSPPAGFSVVEAASPVAMPASRETLVRGSPDFVAPDFPTDAAFKKTRLAHPAGLATLLCNESVAIVAWIIPFLTARQIVTLMEATDAQRLLSLAELWKKQHPVHDILLWQVSALNEELPIHPMHAQASPFGEDQGFWESKLAEQMSGWPAPCRIAWLDALQKVGNPLFVTLKKILYGLDSFAELLAGGIMEVLKSVEPRMVALMVRSHASACAAIQKTIQSRSAEAPYSWSQFAKELQAVATLPAAALERPRARWFEALEELDRASRLHWK